MIIKKMFNSRGFTIDSRMQMVEIAQFNDAQKMEVINHTLQHLANRNKVLLDERLQQINLTKIICRKYDHQNEHWMTVSSMTPDIDNLKKDTAAQELKKIDEMINSSDKTMAENFSLVLHLRILIPMLSQRNLLVNTRFVTVLVLTKVITLQNLCLKE